jgi:hypothetical protein
MTKGSITATCGHKLDRAEDGVDVRYGGYDCGAYGYEKCVAYVVFCPTCAAEAKTWPEYIASDEDERRWFSGPDNEAAKLAAAISWGFQ